MNKIFFDIFLCQYCQYFYVIVVILLIEHCIRWFLNVFLIKKVIVVVVQLLSRDSMDCTMPGFPVLHYLPELAQTQCPLSPWCSPTILSSVIPSSCLQSFPASGPFLMSGLFTSGGPLEKGMANHFSILALRTVWTVWKGKKIWHWKMNSWGQ